ncbi:hypothetical protein CUJ83_02170 [Methanocella sp. CWC-04]|uniref:Uncharacterized protein n=1 Tax=Methanooceanicella nereidis TaxID=2052831 RepID=A0AAP2W537_9EURY|nr:hypothetical protein [Methanocella sp. CWC-04]MCD1293802.1 hypothetical protein [Methanocella sp. CWC-04]
MSGKYREAMRIAENAGLLLAVLQIWSLSLSIDRAGKISQVNTASVEALILTAVIIGAGCVGALAVRLSSGWIKDRKDALSIATYAGAILGGISALAAIILALSEPVIYGSTYGYPYSILGGLFPFDLITYLLTFGVFGISHMPPMNIFGHEYSYVMLLAPLRILWFALIAGIGGWYYAKYFLKK